MSVAYISHDKVNSALARRIGTRLGLDLTVLSLQEAEHAIAADSMVLDLDHLPMECKSKLFLQIGKGELREGVAVHSYHLTPAELRALSGAGVRVTRRLTATVLISRAKADSTGC
jgi:hypothetical protein